MAKTTIVDIDPREMSFIRNEYKGEKWSPVNGDAVVLTVKGEKSGFAERVMGVIDTLKALVGADGEPNADYTESAKAICYAAKDIENAMALDEPSRSQAIVAAVDSVKAGARHSAADMNEINEIALAVQSISTRLASLGYQAPNITDEPNDNPDGAETPGDGDGDADDVAQVAVTDERGTGDMKAKKEGEYGDVAYADEKNKKYPIDTEEHARAAWSYINQEKNAAEYSADELKLIKDRIMAACKKFGIEISDKADLADAIKAQVEPLIAAKAAEFEQQIATVKAEAQSQIDSVKAEADSRVAELESKLQAVTQRAESAEAAVKAVVAEASKPASPGFVPTMRADGTREDPAAESTKAEAIAQIGKPEKIADVLRLQRLAQS